MPGNDGRGYVLRRIMRRAMRHAHLAGAQDPLMHRLVPALVRQMGQAYTRAGAGRRRSSRRRCGWRKAGFQTTLEPGAAPARRGACASAGGPPTFPERLPSSLYDTFGFPLDLTQDALREKGRSVDLEGFAHAMERQKAKGTGGDGRAAAKSADAADLVRSASMSMATRRFPSELRYREARGGARFGHRGRRREPTESRRRARSGNSC